MSHQRQKNFPTQILGIALSGALVAPLAVAQGINQAALFEELRNLQPTIERSLRVQEHSSMSAPESLSIRPPARPSNLNIHQTSDIQDEEMFVTLPEGQQNQTINSPTTNSETASALAPESIGLRPKVRPEGLADRNSNGAAFGSHFDRHIFDQIESDSIPNGEAAARTGQEVNPFTGEPVQSTVSQETPSTQPEMRPNYTADTVPPPVVYTPPEPGSNIPVHPDYQGPQCVAGNVSDLLQSPAFYREVQQAMNLRDISDLYTDTQFWRTDHSFRILPDTNGQGLYIHEEGPNNVRPVNADGSLTYYRVQEICLNKEQNRAHLTIKFRTPAGRVSSLAIHPNGHGSEGPAYNVVAGGATTAAQLVSTDRYSQIVSGNRVRNIPTQILGNIFGRGNRSTN